MPAYGLRISDWSSDVCSSDLLGAEQTDAVGTGLAQVGHVLAQARVDLHIDPLAIPRYRLDVAQCGIGGLPFAALGKARVERLDHAGRRAHHRRGDRKSVVSGTSVAVRVDFGGRRTRENKKNKQG